MYFLLYFKINYNKIELKALCRKEFKEYYFKHFLKKPFRFRLILSAKII